MNRFRYQKLLYNKFVLPAVYGVIALAAPFHRKLRQTLTAHRNVRLRWKAARGRFQTRPVWFHVSSVGEYEQARPVISRLAETHPHIPVAVSFTSPSGYNYASKREEVGNGSTVRFIEYLPIDFADNARFCLQMLDPRLLVFVKFDLWPNLIWEAAALDVPIVLIDATLSESSQRLSVIGRRFYRAVYGNLEKILAISERDADRFSNCAPGHHGISVTGDTRFDRVKERKVAGGGIDIDKGERFVVVAGSTWPRDEEHVLPALARLARESQDVLLVLAPHEPSPARVAHLLEWARSNGIPVSRVSDNATIPDNGPYALVLDSVGKLAELYRFADVAYIGGSFSSGVHSVIEPIELLERGAAFRIRNESDAFNQIHTLHDDRKLRATMGGKASEYVESQLGATDRCVESMLAYL
jgi:3-deoxy-D-manno-octulosonic-acid transferase